jgi:hypothetical protein
MMKPRRFGLVVLMVGVFLLAGGTAAAPPAVVPDSGVSVLLAEGGGHCSSCPREV